MTISMRNLWAVTLLSLALCAYALWQEHAVYEQEELGLLLPDLSAQISDIDQIDITYGLGMSGAQTITIKRQQGRWRLPQRADYSAHQELVNETLLALSEIQKLAPRTTLPEWHGQLGLTDPENLGAAIRFRLSDASGGIVAEILLGAPERSEAEAVQQAADLGRPQENFYVRLADQNQTWLARGRLPRNKNMAVWIDPDLPLMAAANIVKLEYAGAANAVFTRASANDPWSQRAEQLLAGLQTLRPSDVRLAEALDFSKAQSIMLTSGDGAVQSLRAMSDQTDFLLHIDTIRTARQDTGQDAGPDLGSDLGSDSDLRHGSQNWVYRLSSEARAVLLPIFDR